MIILFNTLIFFTWFSCASIKFFTIHPLKILLIPTMFCIVFLSISSSVLKYFFMSPSIQSICSSRCSMCCTLLIFSSKICRHFSSLFRFIYTMLRVPNFGFRCTSGIYCPLMLSLLFCSGFHSNCVMLHMWKFLHQPLHGTHFLLPYLSKCNARVLYSTNILTHIFCIYFSYKHSYQFILYHPFVNTCRTSYVHYVIIFFCPLASYFLPFFVTILH